MVNICLLHDSLPLGLQGGPRFQLTLKLAISPDS